MVAPLVAADVSVSFDGLAALSNVTLEVSRGRVTGLIGPNGAGKTTLVNILTGFQMPGAGRVTLDGRNIAGVKPHLVRRMGIARTFQSGRLFGDLTVHDNLEVAGVGLGLTRREAGAKAAEMLAWIGIVKSQRADGRRPSLYRRASRRHRTRADAVAAIFAAR